MKKILLICLLFLSVTGYGQSLKKKYLGVYEGVIPAYTLDLGSDVVSVREAVIRIELTEKTLTQTIGTVSKQGTWSILSSDKALYVIVFRPADSLVDEHLTLDKKTKTLSREGIYPQPQAVLKKK